MDELTFASYPSTTPKMDYNNTRGINIRDATTIVIFGTIDGILMLAILLGNVLVILAVKLSRKLSGVTSCKFILNLAVCDFFVGLTVPYHLAFYVVDNVGTEKIPCILRFVLISFACTSSILNLIIIAIDRYIAIVHPLHYTRYMTRQVANCLMTCGWIVAFTVATIPLYWNAWTPNAECELEEVMPKYYVNLVLTPLFMAIWSTMFTLYFRIWREAYGHAKRLRNYQNGGSNDYKSMQMVLLILGCFTICWLPYLIVMIYKKTTDFTVPSAVYESTFTLAMANSCMNPLIYAWKNSNFRSAFSCLLRFKRPELDNRPNYITNHIPTNIAIEIDEKRVKVGSTNFVGVCNVSDVLRDEMDLHANNTFVTKKNHSKILEATNSTTNILNNSDTRM